MKSNNKLDRHLKKAKESKNNMIMMYNDHARCICIFNANDKLSMCDRFSLHGGYYDMSSDFHKGMAFDSLLKFGYRGEYFEVIGTWKE